MGPRDDDKTEGLQFVDEIKGGVIPKEFIPSIQKGFELAMKNGALAGYPMDSMKVRLFHGSFHDVDSDNLSFELAAQLGYKAAAKQAGAKIQEPIMEVVIITPDDYTGAVTGDLNKRRGIMQGMDAKAGAQEIKATFHYLNYSDM